MTAKHWLLAGFGCVVVSVLTGVALVLYWMGQVRSSFLGDLDSPQPSDPSQGLGIAMVVVAFANLLLFGGIVVLIIGFIKLAKEPSGGTHTTPGRREPPDAG